MTANFPTRIPLTLFVSLILTSVLSAQVPTITSVVPDSIFRGTQLAVTITGQNTSFVVASGTSTIANVSSVSLSQGSSITNATGFVETNATNLTANFTIPPNAKVGSWNVNVTQIVGGIVSSTNGITILHNPLEPTVPQNLAARGGNTKVSLVWNRSSSPRFSRYLIYRGTVPGDESLVDSSSASITDTSRASSGLLNGQTYYFTVTAIDSSRLESSASNESSAIPHIPPTILSVVPNTAMQGELLAVTITGQNSDFVLAAASGTTNNVDSMWLSRGGVTFNASNFFAMSATNITASLAIPPNPATGPWDVHVLQNTGDTATLIGGFTITLPQLRISQASLVFGNKAIGDSGQATTYAINKSLTSMTVSTATTNTAAFTTSLTTPSIVNGHDSLAIVVNFKPTVLGVANDTLKLVSDAGNVSIALSGNSPKPGIYVGTGLIAFGNTGIYDTSSASVLVANYSLNALHIDSIVTRTGAFLTSFQSQTVGALDTIPLIVRFVPGRVGSFTDSLSVWSNGDSSLVVVRLSGFCPSPAIVTVPGSIDFGTVKKDSTFQKLCTIQDTSISRLQVDSLWTGTPYFAVIHHPANGIVKKGDTLAITVNFTPDSSRTFADTLYISSSSTVTVSKIPLRGNGITTKIAVSGSQLPKAYALHQNYPNPFNPSTTIEFELPAKSRVHLLIYNILGQQVAGLVDEELGAGYIKRSWNANVASGLYFYRIDAVSVENPTRKFVQVKKMILLK